MDTTSFTTLGLQILLKKTLNLLTDVSLIIKREFKYLLWNNRNPPIRFIVTSICQFYLIKLAVCIAFSMHKTQITQHAIICAFVIFIENWVKIFIYER